MIIKILKNPELTEHGTAKYNPLNLNGGSSWDYYETEKVNFEEMTLYYDFDKESQLLHFETFPLYPRIEGLDLSIIKFLSIIYEICPDNESFWDDFTELMVCDEMLEIKVASFNKTKRMFFSNTVFLMNDNGKTIDRY
jgi:hypothetical protein